RCTGTIPDTSKRKSLKETAGSQTRRLQNRTWSVLRWPNCSAPTSLTSGRAAISKARQTAREEAMSKELEYRLADSTVVEPLINNWLAWSYAVAPVPASLHLADYQIRMLKSYLQDPQSHVNASHDPNLMGGPFVNIAVERAGAVKQLLADTEKRLA